MTLISYLAWTSSASHCTRLFLIAHLLSFFRSSWICAVYSWVRLSVRGANQEVRHGENATVILQNRSLKHWTQLWDICFSKLMIEHRKALNVHGQKYTMTLEVVNVRSAMFIVTKAACMSLRFKTEALCKAQVSFWSCLHSYKTVEVGRYYSTHCGLLGASL